MNIIWIAGIHGCERALGNYTATKLCLGSNIEKYKYKDKTVHYGVRDKVTEEDLSQNFFNNCCIFDPNFSIPLAQKVEHIFYKQFPLGKAQFILLIRNPLFLVADNCENTTNIRKYTDFLTAVWRTQLSNYFCLEQKRLVKFEDCAENNHKRLERLHRDDMDRIIQLMVETDPENIFGYHENLVNSL